MNSEIGRLNVVVNLDSTGFQNGISTLNRQMKIVQSEFQAASARLGEFGSSTDRLKLQADALSKQVEIQKQKVAALEQAYQRSVEAKGADAKATQDLAIKLNKAQAELAILESELQKTTAELERQGSAWYKLGQASESFKSVGQKIESVGKSLTTKITLPLAAMGAGITKVGMDFEAQMSRVAAISGASGKDLQALTNLAKEMGSTTKFSATESAQALEYMAMAGWNTQQMLAGLPGVLSLAAASGEELGKVSDIVTDAMTAFGMQASEAGKFANILAAASANANTNVGMLGESFKYVAPVAGSLGMSAKDTAIALGLMANAGIKGSQAGTALRAILTRLVDPPKEAAVALQQLGISVKNADGTVKPLKQVMEELREVFAKLPPAQQAQMAATIAGQEAMSGLLAVVNASDADFQKLTQAIYNSEGAAKKMAKEMQDNLQGRLTELRSALEGVGIQLYDTLKPSLEKIVSVLKALVDAFSKLPSGAQTAIVVFAALAAAIGPLLIVIGLVAQGIGAVMGVIASLSAILPVLGTAFTLLTGPIGLLIAALATVVAAGVAVYKNWEDIKNFGSLMWQNLLAGFQSGSEGLKVSWQYLKDSLTEIWRGLWDGVLTLFQRYKDLISTLTNKLTEEMLIRWEKFKSGLLNIWDAITNTLKAYVNKQIGFVNKLIDALNTIKVEIPEWVPFLGGMKFEINLPHVPYLAEGGIITKPTLAVIGEAGPEAVVPLNKGNFGQKIIIEQINIYGHDADEIWNKFERELYRLGVRMGA